MPLPYPYERWPEVDPALVGGARGLGHVLAALSRAGSGAAPWLGSAIELEAARVVDDPPWPPEPTAEHLALLSAAGDPRPVAALRFGATFAATLFDRALGGEGSRSLLPAPLSEIERGVLTFAWSRVLGGPPASGLELFGLTSSPSAALQALGGTPLFGCGLRVTIGGALETATLWARPDAHAPVSGCFVRVASAPIALALELGRVTLDAATLAACRRGDVLLPDQPRQAGEAELRAVGAPSFRLRVTIGEVMEGEPRVANESPEQDWIMVRDAAHCPPNAERSRGMAMDVMDDEDSANEALIARLGEAPIEVRLELARFELPLREIARLGPGSIVRTGAKIDANVSLWVGERRLGSGELVTVDGEIGARLTSLDERGDG